MQQLKRTWVEIDLDALQHNFNAVRAAVGSGCDIMSVVKADAYGHGSRQAAFALQQAGTDWFAVSNINEAKALRLAGITKPILILGYTPAECVRELFELDITQTVFGLEYGDHLARAAEREGLLINVHIKVDTGMSRLGFSSRDPRLAAEDIAAVCANASLRATGIFTHFAVADENSKQSDAFTRSQYRAFCEVLGELEERGLTFFHRHCCNSAATLTHPEYHMDLVRPGVILYGLSPSGEPIPGADLRPVMTLKSVVSMVKDVQVGEPISYGCTYTADRPMQVATLPIGYADGFPRCLSNKGMGYVRGHVAPIVGRICMDQLMLDVTGIDVQEGDVVTLFGSGCPISLDNVAVLAGTINYELMCGISRRVQRIYIKDGRLFDVVDYTL